MKFRDLKLTFSISDTDFTVLSICLEKLIQPIPKHSHSKNSYELHYIPYGYGTLIVNKENYDILPGTLFMTGPEIEHEQISTPENPMSEYSIYFKVKSKSKQKTNDNNLIQYFLERSFWIGTGGHYYNELMKQILLELETKRIGYELVLQALLQQVILQMIRNYRESDGNEVKPASDTQNANDLTYLIIEEAFLYDYKDITLEDLARKVGLGKRQAQRLLQLHYNKTFLQKRTEARMFAACTLLRETKQSISSIAYSLGYSSVEHFSNAFKKYFHKTASAFRKELP